MSQPSSTSIAAMAGIVGSSWVAGGISSLSLITIPALLSSNTPDGLLANQWQDLYNRGKMIMPAGAVVSLIGFAYASYHSRSYGNRWKQYAAAAALTIAIVPFTLGVMAGTNGQLSRAAASGAAGGVAMTGLVTKWSNLNLGRSLFPLLGAAVGIWTLVGW